MRRITTSDDLTSSDPSEASPRGYRRPTALIVVAAAIGAVSVALPVTAARLVTSATIQDETIVTVDVRDNSLLGDDIRNGTLSSRDVMDDSLQTNDISDGSLTGVDVRDDSLTGDDVRTGSLDSTDLADGAIDTPDLRNGAVGSAKIENGAVTPAKIQNGAVTSAKIENGAVSAIDLADGLFGTPAQRLPAPPSTGGIASLPTVAISGLDGSMTLTTTRSGDLLLLTPGASSAIVTRQTSTPLPLLSAVFLDGVPIAGTFAQSPPLADCSTLPCVFTTTNSVYLDALVLEDVPAGTHQFVLRYYDDGNGAATGSLPPITVLELG